MHKLFNLQKRHEVSQSRVALKQFGKPRIELICKLKLTSNSTMTWLNKSGTIYVAQFMHCDFWFITNSLSMDMTNLWHRHIRDIM